LYAARARAHQRTTPRGRGVARERGGGRLSEVEPVAVRVVGAVVGAEVWVAKAVKVVETRWSELPRPRLVFLALGLEGALGGERERQPRPPLLSVSERPWPGAPLVAGAAFEVVTVLAAASASARCLRLACRPPCRRSRGCRATPECVVVAPADVELVTDWRGSGEGRVAGVLASTVYCTCVSICVALMAASLWCFFSSARTAV
jgi:hypothetical protein